MFKSLVKSVFVLLLALPFAGCGGGGGGGGSEATGTATVLVYIVGSDLESKYNNASKDILEMMEIGSTSNLKVIIETGGSDKDGWRTVQRHMVLKDDGITLDDLGSQNMGDTDTLKDFIVWGITTYPADKYHLILWDHGAGVNGFGKDDNYGGDGLILSEMEQALSQAKVQTGVTFEVLGFDACLMATLEVASLSSPYAKYLVASEELEPGHGWDYTPVLSALKNNPKISGSALGKTIANSYKAQADSTNSKNSITLSVMDLSRISAIESAWENLMEVAAPTNQDEFIVFGNAANRVLEFGRATKQGESDSNMVDISDLASKFSETYPSEALSVADAIDAAVVYNVGGIIQTRAHGLSIKLPGSTDELNNYRNETSFDNYLGALTAFYSFADPDTTPPTFSSETINWVSEEYSAVVNGDDVANLYATVWYQDDSGGTFFLGMDTPSSIVGNTASYGLPTYWLTLDSHLVSVFVADEFDSIYLLDMPVILNGVPVDILAWFDADSGEYYIQGAWPGYDGLMAEREILPIGDGDVIIPYFITFNSTSGSWEYAFGEEFTVSGTPALGIEPLPLGTYYVAFYAEDYAGNSSLSDLVAGEYSLARSAQKTLSRDSLISAQETAFRTIRTIRKTEAR